MPEQLRGGEIWTLEECERLVSSIRAGLPWRDVAEALGRSESAIRARAALMYQHPVDSPDEAPRSRNIRSEAVRQLLIDPTFDWLAALQQGLQQERPASRLWLPSDRTELENVWARGEPGLPQLAERFQVSEYFVARQLIAFGIARGLADVAARLAYSPGGVIDQRLRLAADPASARIIVLLGVEVELDFESSDASNTAPEITWAGLTRVPSGRVRHLTVHTTIESAERQAAAATKAWNEKAERASAATSDTAIASSLRWTAMRSVLDPNS